MRVYRLETPDGTGVFTAGAAYAYQHKTGINPYGHPTPQREGLRVTASDYCGFADERQLRLWFPTLDQHPDVFDQYGVQLVVFDVPDNCVEVGNVQLVFKRDLSRIVERVPVTQTARVFA